MKRWPVSDILIQADSYQEFASKVKADAKKRGMGSLVFLKAAANNVTFTDKEGNRVHYQWYRRGDRDEHISDE